MIVRWITWLLVGAALVGAVSSMLGSGPERIRALLLFPVGFGLLVGGSLAMAAREWQLRPRWLVACVSCLLVCGGLVVVAVEAYGELAAMAEARVRDDPTQLLGLRLLEDQQAADPAHERQYREQRMALDPRFEDYLMGRVAALGVWRSPWPTVLWIVELVAAAAGAGWISHRTLAGSPGPKTDPASSSTVDSDRDTPGNKGESQ